MKRRRGGRKDEAEGRGVRYVLDGSGVGAQSDGFDGSEGVEWDVSEWMEPLRYPAPSETQMGEGD
jgi:hypothetical protein